MIDYSIEPKFTTNPFEDVHKKGYKTGQKALTEENVKSLLESIGNLEHLALIQLGISAGIRREDIVRIKTKDIDFNKGTVVFYEHKKRRTKTVFPGTTSMNSLKMLKTINKKSEFLFPGRSEKKYGKGHLSGRQAYNILNTYLEKAGLDKRPFHALRATCIKLCQKKGWTAEQTAEHVGDTIRVIQEHYATPSTDEMRQVASEKSLI